MYCDLWSQYIQLRKLFEGGNYSRAETIRGNTVAMYYHCKIFYASDVRTRNFTTKIQNLFSLETYHNFCLLSDIFPHTRHILHCTKILQYSLDTEHMNLPDDFHIPPFYLKNQGLGFKNLIEQVLQFFSNFSRMFLNPNNFF